MRPKIIHSKYFPPKGYIAICLFFYIIVREEYKHLFTDVCKNHETIHVQQQKEMLIIPFFIWYGIEWFIKLCYYRDFNKAYRNLSFEREAFNNDDNLTYLNTRPKYSWFHHIIQRS